METDTEKVAMPQLAQVRPAQRVVGQHQRAQGQELVQYGKVGDLGVGKRNDLEVKRL